MARADRDPVADLQVEPREKRRVDRRAEGAVALGEEIGGGELRIGLEGADGGIAPIDRLHLHEARAFLAGHRHGAHGGDDVDPSLGFQEGAFGPCRLALEQGKGHVAAEDPPPLAGDALGKRAGEGGDAGDRGDAERDAGEEDAEALQASAQLAEGEAQQERQAGAGGRPSLRRGGKGAVHER